MSAIFAIYSEQIALSEFIYTLADMLLIFEAKEENGEEENFDLKQNIALAAFMYLYSLCSW